MGSGTQSPHSHLLQWQVRNLLARMTGSSRKTLHALTTGIMNQSITRIGVYGVDEQNRCHVSLQLIINWAPDMSQVLALGEREAIAEAVFPENDLSSEVWHAIDVFNQAVAAGNLRTEWYYPDQQDLDPAASELQGLFQGFSTADVPTESGHDLLQRLYAGDVLTKSSQRSVRIVRMKEGEVADHVERLRQEAHFGEGRPPAVRQHVEQLREEAKIPQGIIYQRGSLPEKYENYAKEFVEALGNPQHSLRQLAEQTLHRVAAAVEKPQVLSLSQASREYHLPLKNLSRWVADDLIPVKYRDKDTIYLAKETLEEVARIYGESKKQGAQTAPLLRAMRDELRERQELLPKRGKQGNTF